MSAIRFGMVGTMAALLVCAGTVLAQGAANSEDSVLKIRKLSDLGRMEIETPQYDATGGGSSRSQKTWQRILVSYDTVPEWIDDLSITYALLCRGTDENGEVEYSLFRVTVRYTDVEEKRGHLAAAYLRPAAVKRYGEPIAVAVEFQHKGKVVATKSEQPNAYPADWWKNPKIIDNDKVRQRNGYLLSRKDTPFYLINYDDYEVIK